MGALELERDACSGIVRLLNTLIAWAIIRRMDELELRRELDQALRHNQRLTAELARRRELLGDDPLPIAREHCVPIGFPRIHVAPASWANVQAISVAELVPVALEVSHDGKDGGFAALRDFKVGTRNFVWSWDTSLPLPARPHVFFWVLPTLGVRLVPGVPAWVTLYNGTAGSVTFDTTLWGRPPI